MGEGRVDVLLEVAEANLLRAEKRLRDGEYDAAVFHASMAAESAAHAMILQLGGTEAKNHKAISALAVVMRRARPELLKEERYRQLIARGRKIEREVVFSRYPLKIAGQWISPMKYFTLEKAGGSVEMPGSS